MKLSHDEQRALAYQVLKAMRVHPNVSFQFKKGSKNHRLFYSERANKAFPAILYYLDNNPEWLPYVEEFQNATGNLVYHATLTHTEFGDLLDLLSVPSDTEGVQRFFQDLKDGCFYSHCINLSDGFAEGGYIRVRPAMGGLERIA